MTVYIYDETDIFFRSPTGAVKAPGKLSLHIKLRRGAATGVKVSLYPDGGAPVDTEMVFDHVTGAYDVYKGDLHIQTQGLYWYRFTIERYDGGIERSPEHEGGAYQITAFTPAPVEPDWIYGGLIYHIFVDRFYPGGKRGRDKFGVRSPELETKSSEPGIDKKTGTDAINDTESEKPYFLRPEAVYRADWGGCPRFLPDEKGIVRNNDFFGGDLNGIAEKLPYLAGLGVTCIYLSPVFEAASNHKYDTGDYFKIDPAFGGDEAFERLCAEAGSLGMRVMLDGVFNHVGSDSRYFNRYGNYDSLGAYQSKDSPYYDWFTFREDGTYDSWWGIELLPSLNETNTSYRDFICGEDGVLAHWMRKGVSAWRLDVVDELPDSFLDPLSTAVKREKSDAMIVGEVWEDASNKIAYSVRRRYFNGGQLDSVTNYPLKEAIIACVKEGEVERLAETMASLCKNYPENVLHSLMNIIGTHDTMRILTVLSGAGLPCDKVCMSEFRLTYRQRQRAKKLLKLASLLQFTLPGVPCLYYGDEAGMEGGADPLNRGCYPWGSEDRELIEWYTAINKIRREHICFLDGQYELVEARDGLFAFTRGREISLLLIAINTSDKDRTLGACGFNYDLLKNEYTDSLTIRAFDAGIFMTKGDITIR